MTVIYAELSVGAKKEVVWRMEEFSAQLAGAYALRCLKCGDFVLKDKKKDLQAISREDY
jgi:hypothetical protein